MKLLTDLVPGPAVQVEADDEPEFVSCGQSVNIQASITRLSRIRGINQNSALKFGVKLVKRLVEALSKPAASGCVILCLPLGPGVHADLWLGPKLIAIFAGETVNGPVNNLAHGPHVANYSGYDVTQIPVYWSHAAVNPLEVYRPASRVVILNAYWCQPRGQDVNVLRNGNKSQESPFKKKNFTTMSENTLSHAFVSEGRNFRSIRGPLVGMLQQRRRCCQCRNEDRNAGTSGENSN